MRRRNKLLLTIILTLAVSQLTILALLVYFNYSSVKKAKIGVTFSAPHARYFNLDPRELLKNSLNDLKIKNYRLSAYWNSIERQKNKFDFSDLDWQIDEIEKRGGQIILAIGRRLPRWPECHEPAWAKKLRKEDMETRILLMLEVVINRYKERPSITAWQVENEALLSVFGECPPPDKNFFKKEIELVKKIDERPIIITESGELSSWLNGASLADRVGISLYRTVWNKVWGTFYYPLTPAYYKHRARAIRAVGKKIFVSELQAEPWGGKPIKEMPLAEQKKLMNGEKLKRAVDFAKRAGFDEIYLWGVEWWGYLKSQGDNEMWETVKKIVEDN